jgi:potassium-dependent mechanosensitive channel
MSLKYSWRRIAVALGTLGCLVFPLVAQAQPHPDKSEKASVSPQALTQVFQKAITGLQERLKEWESRVAAASEKLAQTRVELDDLQVAVASLKATLVLEKPPLLQVQEFIATYAAKDKEFKGRLEDLGQEIDVIKKAQQDQVESQNALRVQFSIIQAKAPEALTPALQQAYLTYLELAGTRVGLMEQVLNQLEQRRQLLESEKTLVENLPPQLKKLEEAWKAQLLKRPAQSVPFWEQVAGVWAGLAAVPARGWDWLNNLVESGRLSAFVWSRLASIIGLLGLIVLLGWSTRRLNALVSRRLENCKAQAEDPHLLPLYVLGQILIANLFGLDLILWVSLFFWTFSLMDETSAQLILAVLATLWGLRLTLQCIQGFFAGQAAGGVLSLDGPTARFYRRSLKLFPTYLFLGFFGLKCVVLLNFPESSRSFLEHFFLLGVLLWGWWLLRRPYLTRLLPELSDPTWLHHPAVSLILRGLVLFLLVVIILADLLGFQNLSLYLTRAAAWTLLDMMILWFLWLIGETIIRHLLHPGEGRATLYYPEKTDLIQKTFSLCRWVLSIVLGVAVVLWSLNAWGIKPRQVAWAFQWLTWGPDLGPVKLTTLNVGGASLVLYLGFFLSRLGRSLMLARIFPRTALDTGVQYTISTTLHYVILILTGIIALNILGFPLTNLALVAGALGVGIGFGLQNIVNNFLSGLILLFERPIKVGDMLVIDGQWGRVKEIRVRSTIFETFDRYVLIIPNSELVSNKVLNWTHYGAGINRLTLKVGVSFDSDVRQVTQVLTEICRANPRVVAEPPPQVYFAVYGDSSLDFTIWVYVHTPSDRMSATHELNGAIFKAFREHGIEIPFPQRDLHIKGWPEAVEKNREV